MCVAVRGLLAGCLWAFIAWGYAAAADWKPEKNVEIISGVAAGGALDITARTMQKIWQDRRVLNQSATVINKPGSGSAVAWTYLNQHPGDGHYLSVTSATLLTNAITGANPLTYTDVTPLAQLLSEYIVFTVKVDSPIASGRDLIERLGKDPRAFSFGLATSLGNPNHIAIAQVARAGGVDVKQLKIAVFNASSQAMSALLGGHIDILVSNASNPAPQIAAKQLRAVGVAAPRRLAAVYADVPTWKEQKLDMVAAFWRGVIGPKGMSPAQVAFWDDILARLVKTEEWRTYLQTQLLVDDYMGSSASRKFLEAEYQSYKAILTELGLAR